MQVLSNPSPDRSPRNRLAAALRPLQWALLASGATLLLTFGAVRLHSAVGGMQALEAFAVAEAQAARQTAALAADGGAAPATLELARLGEPDQSLWGKARIAAYRALGPITEPPLGVLAIPDLELEVPIFVGTDEVALNRGVGHIEGTADVGRPGNVGLAGHRDGFFRPLKDIKNGDLIEVRSLEGTTRYRVSELLIVEPADVYVLDPTADATLTLVTCYPFYFVGNAPQRFIVKAVAITG
jgi:sortase A